MTQLSVVNHFTEKNCTAVKLVTVTPVSLNKMLSNVVQITLYVGELNKLK